MLNIFALVFGLLSTLSFGSADFSGGFVTKKTNVFLVLLYSQIIGLIFIFISIFLIGERIVFNTMIFSAVGGLCGGVGLLAYYRGLSLGNMGIVAPITAIITPIIPLLFSFFSLEYSVSQILGIILALLAIWCVSTNRAEKTLTYNALVLAIIAGVGFGFFLLFINLASTNSSVLFPIFIARCASVCMMGLVVLSLKKFHLVQPKILGLTAIAGILDTAGNVFFILSSKAGRLDSASILLSFGPAVTVLLAWYILHEKLTKIQIFGLALSIISITLLSA